MYATRRFRIRVPVADGKIAGYFVFSSVKRVSQRVIRFCFLDGISTFFSVFLLRLLTLYYLPFSHSFTLRPWGSDSSQAMGHVGLRFYPETSSYCDTWLVPDSLTSRIRGRRFQETFPVYFFQGPIKVRTRGNEVH